MAKQAMPHLVNDAGVVEITIGVKEFQCMGASPPHDHPHVFLDMGDADQIICPYCSTVYAYDATFAADQSEPPGSVAKFDEVAWRGRAGAYGPEKSA